MNQSLVEEERKSGYRPLKSQKLLLKKSEIASGTANSCLCTEKEGKTDQAEFLINCTPCAVADLLNAA